jgi:hypothetical protein
MNNKQNLTKYFIGGVVVIGGLGVFSIIFFFFHKLSTPQNKLPIGNTFSITPILPKGRTSVDVPLLTTVTQQATIDHAVRLNKNNSIPVNNFIATATKKEDGLLLLVEVPQSYTITYTPSIAKFEVSITGADFNSLRKTAEQNLLDILGVSPQQACKLNIGVSVAYAINPYYATIERQPQFCLTSDQIKEDQVETFLSNNLPKSDLYAVSAYYLSSPTNHFQFQVVLQGSDINASKQAFHNALTSLGISEAQISKLDILYSGPIGPFESGTNPPPSTEHD